MDNDLMARRLRPPSQPNSGTGQQPAQEPSPWDVPLADEGQFAPADPQAPQDVPPFAPQWAPPDPAARADVPWDRPAAEPWPPTDDSQTWSAQGDSAGGAGPARPDWPAADPLTDTAAPWDRPAPNGPDQWRDPDDALAPLVGDVQGPAAAWSAWNGNSNGNGHANGNGYGAGAVGGGNGIRYANASTPEPMKVTAQSDRPIGDDEPHWAGVNQNPTPEWPAEDDLTATPPAGRGPVMPEDSWPATPPPPQQEAAPAWPPIEAAPPTLPAQPDLPPQPEPAAPPPAPQPQAPQPQAPQPTLEVAAPPNAHIVAVTPTGTPQNMVLRIELAIVDESHRANPADAAKRVGPDADVRRPEYEPRNHGGRAPMPEPEYDWGAPPNGARNEHNNWPRQPQNQQRVAPPPDAWLPAPQPPQQHRPPQQPQNNMDWALPQVPAPPMVDPPAPWSSPAPYGQSGQHQSPYAPAPTWAMTQPTPAYQPEPPQYIPPPTPQYQQPPAPPQGPAYQQPYQPTGYPPAQQSAWPPAAQQAAWPPARPQHMPQPGQSAVMAAQSAPIVSSSPAAGSRARTGQAATADQADLWFLNNGATSAATAEDIQTEGKSSSILTAGLTIGFALLVIVLVLVFIQLMTSLLK